MITELRKQMNIKYSPKVGLFSLDLKGIRFGLSRKELLFLAGLIGAVLMVTSKKVKGKEAK